MTTDSAARSNATTLSQRLTSLLVSSALAVLVNVLSITSFVLLTTDRLVMLGYLFAVLVVLAAVWRSLGNGAAYGGARTVVVCGLLARFTADPGIDLRLVVSAAVVLGLVLHEPMVRKLVRPGATAVHLPGYEDISRPLVDARQVFLLSCGFTLLLALAAITDAPPVLVLVVVGVGGVVAVVSVLVHLRQRLRHVQTRHGTVREALEAYAPSFLVYFSGPAGSEYQLKMWLPYLDRLGERYVIMLREARTLPEVAAATTAPVLVCTTLTSVDTAIVDSLRAVFYVNNGFKNTHCVRYSQLTHVQLLHGDSDKPPSYSPVTAMFDKVFVAGQAGIDRYAAHGVDIPAEKFVIVGRPQVEGIRVCDRPVSEVGTPTVLYAPTWHGHYADTDFCSLPVGLELIRTLLDRGARVIFRPHPYSRLDSASRGHIEQIDALLADDEARTGRGHLWGRAAGEELSVLDCFERSDALISDMSSVVSDYLYSLKPFAVIDMTTEGENFSSVFPMARAAYVLRRDLAGSRAVLDEMLTTDSLRPVREDMRTYYLGPFPPDDYARAFVSAALSVVQGEDVPRVTTGATPAAEVTRS